MEISNLVSPEASIDTCLATLRNSVMPLNNIIKQQVAVAGNVSVLLTHGTVADIKKKYPYTAGCINALRKDVLFNLPWYQRWRVTKKIKSWFLSDKFKQRFLVKLLSNPLVYQELTETTSKVDKSCSKFFGKIVAATYVGEGTASSVTVDTNGNDTYLNLFNRRQVLSSKDAWGFGNQRFVLKRCTLEHLVLVTDLLNLKDKMDKAAGEDQKAAVSVELEYAAKRAQKVIYGTVG